MQLIRERDITNGMDLYYELEDILHENRYEDIYEVLDLVVEYYDGLGEDLHFKDIIDFINYELTESTKEEISHDYDFDFEELDDDEILKMVSDYTLVLGWSGNKLVYVLW